MAYPQATEADFWIKVWPSGECWLWTGRKQRDGYGRVRWQSKYGRKLIRAHRVSWEIFNGAVPTGYWVLHHCDVRNCVNPKHLFLGDHIANMRDMAMKGRADNRAGERHHLHKLTWEQVTAIRRRYRQGELQRVIAASYGVSKSSVSLITRGAEWKEPRRTCTHLA